MTEFFAFGKEKDRFKTCVYHNKSLQRVADTMTKTYLLLRAVHSIETYVVLEKTIAQIFEHGHDRTDPYNYGYISNITAEKLKKKGIKGNQVMLAKPVKREYAEPYDIGLIAQMPTIIQIMDADMYKYFNRLVYVQKNQKKRVKGLLGVVLLDWTKKFEPYGETVNNAKEAVILLKKIYQK